MSGTSSLAKQLMKETGPDDFYSNITAKDIFQCVVLDECGPFFIKNGLIMEQVYIMVTLELVTNRTHLIPIKYTLAKSLIRSLEKLQGIHGRLTMIIVDETK